MPRRVVPGKHDELLKETQQWLKGRSLSAVVVAAYIVAMIYATRFTVQVETMSENKPLFLHNAVFMFYAISDELALLSS